jgi:hypothetical protein
VKPRAGPSRLVVQVATQTTLPMGLVLPASARRRKQALGKIPVECKPLKQSFRRGPFGNWVVASSATYSLLPEQPLVNVVRDGPQPLIADPFAIDGCHIVTAVPHDVIHSHLVAAIPTDSLEGVP